ncbi:MAG: molecular chaperone TorD [Geobacteraceae bacterium GWC2_58_44]|nr:MAG: molecular chaperone TorD [Geobacteraceae bacterium GWC2_58_44]
MYEPRSAAVIREDVYRLLAACYYSPTPALRDETCCDALADLLSVLAPAAAAQASEAASLLAGQSMETLAIEHARLFLGPFQLVAPPYGSYYLDEKSVMGDSTVGVAAFYTACGLHLADDYHELPDHITAELEFMSFLAFGQRQAEAAGSREESKRLVGLQREFLGKFLMPWLEPFTAAIISDGEAPFYQAIARCTAAFIDAENAALAVSENG